MVFKTGSKNQKGSAAVELGLIMMLLVVLTMGTVEFSTAWRIRSVMQEAVRDGVRLASLKPDLKWNDQEIIEMVDQMVQESGFHHDDYTLGLSWDVDAGDEETLEPGDPVRMSMTYFYQSALIGFIPVFRDRVLREHSTMRYQFRSDADPGDPNEIPGGEPPAPPGGGGGGGGDDGGGGGGSGGIIPLPPSPVLE